MKVKEEEYLKIVVRKVDEGRQRKLESEKRERMNGLRQFYFLLW